MNRRALLAGGAAALAAATARAATPSRPIVLVHGAWHGGWCWQRVLPALHAAGHAVFTPTLTGLGERQHLARPDINVDQHALDLEMMLEMEDLHDVVLVGHSYAGFPISLLAERVPERLGRLVYLDAFVSENGRSLLDYIEPSARRATMLAAARSNGYVAPLPLAAFGVTRPEDVAWAQPRLAPQPLATLSQPIRLARPAGNGLPRSFIACTQPESGPFGQFAERLRQEPGWQVQELASGHDAMITDPLPLADLLIRIAAGQVRA